MTLNEQAVACLNADLRQTKQNRIFWGLLFIATMFMFVEDWNIKFERILDPYVINSDTRGWLAPYNAATNPELADDYILQYVRNVHPIGYRALFDFTSEFIDPVAFGKILSLLLFFGALTILMLTAKRLEGYGAAWLVFVVFLSASLYFDVISGGLSRSFAIPFMAAMLAALVYGRIYWLALVTILGALFYPMSGLIAGATLFGVLFLLPRADRGDGREWSLGLRIKVVAGVAVLSIVILSPNMTGSDYGRFLGKADYKEFPEIRGRAGEGPGSQGDAYKFNITPLWRQFVTHGRDALQLGYQGQPWSTTLHGLGTYSFRFHYDKYFYKGFIRDDMIVMVLWVAIFIGFGLRVLKKNAAHLRRIAVLVGVSCSGYYLAHQMFPYLYFPARYLQPLTLVFLLMLPVTASSFFDVVKNWFPERDHDRARTGFVLAIALFCVLFLGGRVHKSWLGYDKDYSSAAPYFEYIKTLPKDAMVAAWPKGLNEAVSLLAQRKALVWHEAHLAFYEKYTLTLRARTLALIDAYFADSLEPLLRLRDQFGVTHLSIYKPYLEEKQVWYFAPFLEYAVQKKAAGRQKGYEVLRQIPNAGVFEHDDLITLDLAKLSPVS